MSKLYVVATPIGNLEDISSRAARILGEVGTIAAEDTRTAGILLRHLGISGRLVSYNEHNRAQRIPELLERLATQDIALVSDAGTPAISDPGVELVAAARAAGHEVVAVAGPSAPVAALSVAGLRARSFVFAGFLPRTSGELRRLLSGWQGREEALVAFESPARLRRSLAVIADALPERRLAVCRELTKLHEEVFVGTPSEALDHFESPRGEIVIVIEGGDASASAKDGEDASIGEEIAEMKRLGLTRSQTTALLSKRFRISRRRLYELWLKAGVSP